MRKVLTAYKVIIASAMALAIVAAISSYAAGPDRTQSVVSPSPTAAVSR